MEVLIVIGLIIAAVLLYIFYRRRRRVRPRFSKQTDEKQRKVAARAAALTDAAKDPAFREKLRDLTLRKEYWDWARRKAKIESQLLARPNVVGVAIGKRGDDLVISV